MVRRMGKWIWFTLIIAVLGVVLTWVYFFDAYPPVGACIAVAGLLAVIVTAFPPNDRFSKIIFVAITFTLTAFEIHTIYKERASQDQERAKQRAEETKKFQSIAEGISKSITQNQQAFDATMKRMGSLAQLSEEQIHESTGGDSFCFVTFVTLGPLDTLVANINHRGRYPLFQVRISITDVTALTPALKSGNLDAINATRRYIPVIEFLSRAAPSQDIAVYKVDPTVEHKSFLIDIVARNGFFTELLHYKRLDGNRGWIHWFMLLI
jgi:hypothetical protein